MPIVMEVGLYKVNSTKSDTCALRTLCPVHRKLLSPPRDIFMYHGLIALCNEMKSVSLNLCSNFMEIPMVSMYWYIFFPYSDGMMHNSL